MHVIDNKGGRSGTVIDSNKLYYRVMWGGKNRLSRSNVYKINCTEAKKRSAVGKILSKCKRYTLVKMK